MAAMTNPSPSRQTLLHAYRHLLRAGLRAVQYSSPARYAIRSKLRHAFRRDNSNNTSLKLYNATSFPSSRRPTIFPLAYSQTRIDNTIEFLNTAARRRGLEHTIVKNLCYVEYRRDSMRFSRAGTGMKPSDWEPLNVVFAEFDETVRMLNETMELELR
ncbi:hypothetical protein ABW19_dt0208429 [Dactylella cylindrospora]|nr:hypothetical protein ABW19_dt0208429 [Dactylella cylindrospora]